MHPPEEGMEAVVVVVDLDAGLAGKGSGDPADVLDDPAPTGDREGQEQGVQLGEVEAFAEVGAGGQQQDRGVTRLGALRGSPGAASCRSRPLVLRARDL